ncbi:MAG: hypothetical protein IJI07_12150 [Flexilinea sp.]|nr:hypothetical protein [Flexilinea sp.]
MHTGFTTKIRISVLLIVAILFVSGAFQAQDTVFNNQEQLEYYLKTQQPASLEFTCSKSLYNELEEGGFRELFRLLVRAGIDYDAAEISYSGFRHFISLKSLSYPDLPWEICESLGDVRQAFREHAAAGTDFVLLCTNDLVYTLTENRYLSVYAAQNGINSHATIYSTQSGILWITDIEHFDRPYAAVDDYARFSAAAAYFADRGINDFYIAFDPDLFDKITADPAEMTIMTGSGRIGGYNAEIDPNSCVFHYYDVEFTNVPREICLTTADVSDAIRRMGALGIKDFELIFPYTDVFEKLYWDDFALLLEIRTQAGMVRGDISYSSDGDRIIFSNTEIVPEMTALSTLSEAIAYTENQVNAGSRDIHLFCTAGLYYSLIGEPGISGAGQTDRTRIYDLLAHAGIFDYEITTSEATHLINIRISKLFSGKAILLAVRSGNTGTLSARERQTLEAASSIAAAAKDPDPLQTAKAIHDWLCERISYTEDETTDEDDTAIGAILNGEANCDGYSDAFCLIGSLAGLNVRYQHGDSLDKRSPDARTSVSHLWNLLEIGGAWHMVDVTWDDEESGWSYIWFNAGRDVASRMHVWNEDMTVSLAPDTQRPFNIGSDFYVGNEAEMRTAVETARQQRLTDFHIIFKDPGLAYLNETAREMVMDRTYDLSITYSWNDQMSALGFYDLRW